MSLGGLGWPIAGCFALGCWAAPARLWVIYHVLSALPARGMRDNSVSVGDLVESSPLALQAALVQLARAAQREGANATAMKLEGSAQDFQRCVVGAAGEAIGCRGDCVCAAYQRCYPKHVVGVSELKDNGEHQTMDVDIGICDLSISASILISTAAFVFCLMAVISLRMYLDWKEELAERRLHGSVGSDDPRTPKPT